MRFEEEEEEEGVALGRRKTRGVGMTKLRS